jgi:hypothetical protein
MATYYKWAERHADTTINWAEVGKTLSDTLKQEAAIREAKKAAIDEATRKLGERLDNAPMGEFVPAKEFALGFAGTAQETRLIQDNLLRSGMLSPKDYAIMRQNLNDGTNTMFDLAKVYEEEFQRKMERANALDPKERSQYMERWMMEQAEGMSNLSNVMATINPTNGKVSLGEYKTEIIDGKEVKVLTDDPNKMYTVNELNMRIKQDFNYFDADAAMQNEVDMLGEVKSVIYKTAGQGKQNMIFEYADKKRGVYLTEEEIAALPADQREMAIAQNSYNEAERLAIEKQMANSWNSMSILTDDLNLDYTPTFSKEEADADPTKVYVEQLPSGALEAKLSEEQEELVYDYLKTNLRKRISTTEAAKSAGFTPYSPERRARASFKYSAKGQEEEKKLEAVNLWNKVMYAEDAAARQAALDAIVESEVAKGNGISGITYDKASKEMVFTVQNQDGSTTQKRKSYDPDNITLMDHAELGNIVHGIDDTKKLERVIKSEGQKGTFKYDDDVDFTGFGSTARRDVTQSNVDAYVSELDTAEDIEPLMEEGGYRVTTADGKKVLVDQDDNVLISKESYDDISDDEVKDAIKANVNNPANTNVRNRIKSRTEGAPQSDDGIDTSKYNQDNEG